MSVSIVIGLGFGDEGKGLTTSHLCSGMHDPIVVRFNGGHQAGHTVVREDKRHVFSTYGSGTLQGVPTYWSQYCTLYPVAVVNERKALESIWTGTNEIPKIHVHPLCPVTVIRDVEKNKQDELVNRHGSVGVGFGQTIKRHESYYKIHARDLYFEDVLRAKLRCVYDNYYADYSINYPGLVEAEIADFMAYVDECKRYIEIADPYMLMGRDLVFEGAQGIMLDQDFGFFPHVTRSNTTCKNAASIIEDHVCADECVNVYYVTRTYQTRHGNGPMTREGGLHLVNNENETNRSHPFQGEFRTGELDPELIRYAIECDSHTRPFACNIHLVVTCMDQHPIDIGKLVSDIGVPFSSVLVSESPDSRMIKKLK